MVYVFLFKKEKFIGQHLCLVISYLIAYLLIYSSYTQIIILIFTEQTQRKGDKERKKRRIENSA